MIVAVDSPVPDGRSWKGLAEAYGETFIAEFWESGKNPGYYHYAVMCLADGFNDESRRPIRAGAALDFLTRSLNKHHGLTIKEFVWCAVHFDTLVLASMGGKR